MSAVFFRIDTSLNFRWKPGTRLELHFCRYFGSVIVCAKLSEGLSWLSLLRCFQRAEISPRQLNAKDAIANHKRTWMIKIEEGWDGLQTMNLH